MTHADTLDLNPDCATGKHTACSGTAWCESCDELVPCECSCHEGFQ